MSLASLASLTFTLSSIFLLLTIFSRAIGLGENEGFVIYRLVGFNRTQVAIVAAMLGVASGIAIVATRVTDRLQRASIVIVLFIAVAFVLLVATIFAGQLGLGVNADFVFYRIWGIDRSDLAVGAVAAIILSAIVLAILHLKDQLTVAWRRLFVFARLSAQSLVRQADRLLAMLLGLFTIVAQGSARLKDRLLTKQPLVSESLATGFACAWLQVKMRFARCMASLRAYRPQRLDIVAFAIILAYGVLCASTIFQAYRTYEEAWAFETDGPFYLINLDRLVHGEIGEMSKLAGFFPVIVAYFFSLPLLLVEKIAGDGNHIDSLVVGFRLSQTFFAMLSAALVYRIASVLASRVMGIACLISFISLDEVLRWTALIHPDIQQLAMILAAIYCLVRYSQTLRLNYFFVSAVFAGLATASKLYGLFLLPAAVVAVLAVESIGSPERRRLPRVAMLTAAYVAIHTVAALVMSVPHLFYLGRNVAQLSDFSTRSNLLSFDGALSLDLWTRKAALLFDGRFLGKGICFAFVIVLVYAISRSIEVGRVHRIHILNAFILSFFFMFLTFWGDVFNIGGGYRYLLPAAVLALIVIAVGLHDLGERFQRRGGTLAITGAFLILVVGIPISLTLRAQAMSDRVVRLWAREETGQFKIKEWIEDHLPAGSRIMTQAYTNIQLPGHIPGSLYDAGVKWRGRKDIRAYFDPWNHVYLSSKAIAKINPDYIFAVNPSDVWAILNTFSNYQLVTSVGESGIVYVLGRTDLPPLMLPHHPGPAD